MNEYSSIRVESAYLPKQYTAHCKRNASKCIGEALERLFVLIIYFSNVSFWLDLSFVFSIIVKKKVPVAIYCKEIAWLLLGRNFFFLFT